MDVTDIEVSAINSMLQNIQGIKKIEYISQDEAIKKAGEINSILVSGYSEEQLKEIYQPYFRVTFETIEGAEEAIMKVFRESECVGEEDVYDL